MSLSSWLLAQAFTPGRLSVGVELDGRAVAAPQTVDAWLLAGDSASASVMFRFAKFTRFDSVTVIDDGQVIHRDSLRDEDGNAMTAAVPPGAEWTHTFLIDASTVAEMM